MVRQFCEVCKKELHMKVVTKGTSDHFIWCQCPECKRIAPYKQLKGRNGSFRKEVSPKVRRKERAKQSAKRNGQKRRKNNRCLICGRDKGVNRLYCKTCHSRLSNEYDSEEYGTNIQI